MLCFQNNDADCSLIITQCRRVLQFPSIIEIAFFYNSTFDSFQSEFFPKFYIVIAIYYLSICKKWASQIELQNVCKKTRQFLYFLHNYGMTWTFQTPKSNHQNSSTQNLFV